MLSSINRIRMDLYSDEFLRLIRAFERHQVLYLLVGGFAVIKHGYSRTTGDLDIYLKDTPDNRQKLIDAFEEVGYGRLEGLLRVPFIAGYCEVMMNDGMYADLMSELPGLSPEEFDMHRQLAVTDMIEGVTVRFLHYNALIENKLATGRPKDLADVRHLEEIHNKKHSQ